MKDRIWGICMKWGIVNQHWSDGDRERLTQEIADALTAEDDWGTKLDNTADVLLKFKNDFHPLTGNHWTLKEFVDAFLVPMRTQGVCLCPLCSGENALTAEDEVGDEERCPYCGGRMIVSNHCEYCKFDTAEDEIPTNKEFQDMHDNMDTAEDENQAAKRLIEEYEEEEGGCSIYLLDFIDWLDRREK